METEAGTSYNVDASPKLLLQLLPDVIDISRYTNYSTTSNSYPSSFGPRRMVRIPIMKMVYRHNILFLTVPTAVAV